MARQVEALATGRTAVAQALRSAGADRNLSNFIGNNIAVSGLGSSQVIDLTVTLVPRWLVAQRRRPGSPSADEPGMAACPGGT